MNATSTRQERRKERTRRRLLDAARRVIARQGYDSTGVLDITEAADVSKGTFYQYFKDKEDLTGVLIMEGFKELRALIDDQHPAEIDLSFLRETLRAVFQYAADNRDLFRIMLGRQASAELNMMAINYYTEVVEETLVNGGLSANVLPYPPGLLAHFIAGACVRLGMWWVDQDHGLSTDQISEITYNLLTNGVFAMLPPDRFSPAAS